MVRDASSKIARYDVIFNRIKKRIIYKSASNIIDYCWKDYVREKMIRG